MADKVQKYSEPGKITCDKDILYSIVNLATKEIKGVASLTNSSFPWYKKMFKKNDYEGVLIKFNVNGSLKVDVFINAYIGESIPDLAYRIQENIKNNLSSMVDIKATKINVHVMDVVCKVED